jgi:hypothetical protein
VRGRVGLHTIIASVQHEDSGGHEPECAWSEHILRTGGKSIRARPLDPEELIEEAEARARISTLQRDKLLTQSKILEKETSSSAKKTDQHSEAESYETKHGQDCRTVVRWQQAMLLIFTVGWSFGEPQDANTIQVVAPVALTSWGHPWPAAKLLQTFTH